MRDRQGEQGRQESMQVIILLEIRLTARLTQPQEDGGGGRSGGADVSVQLFMFFFSQNSSSIPNIHFV